MWTDAPRADRPGLGTEWGEARFSPVHDVAFERDGDRPFSLLSVYYNDREGASAMASRASYTGNSLPGAISVRGGIEVSVVDELLHLLGFDFFFDEGFFKTFQVIDGVHSAADFEL